MWPNRYYALKNKRNMIRITSIACIAGFVVGGFGSSSASDSIPVKDSVRENPFLMSWENRAYRIPPFSSIKEEDYLPALQKGIEYQNQAIQSIIRNRAEATFENTVLALEKSGELIDKVSAVLFNVAAAHSNENLRQIEAEAMQMLSSQSDKVYMNPFLLRRVKRLKEQGYVTDPAQKKLLDDMYRDFVLSGAELSPQAQDSLKAVNARLSELGSRFAQNLLLATADYTLYVEDASRLEGLPADALQRAARKAEAAGRKGYAFGLDNPTIMPFLQYVKDAGLRKEILDAYAARCQAGSKYDNSQIVKELVELRLKKAQLLGFPDYASYVLQTRMAKNPEAVYALLDEIWPYALERAKDELAQMKKFRKKEDGLKGDFLPSDWRYYANRVKQAEYALDENELKPYLTVDNVRNGIFYLCQRLYGIGFELLPDAETPTPNTTAYLCKDKDGSVLGVLFLDMTARPGQKSGGAWNTSYVEQSYREDGKRLTPVTSIVCNFTPAAGDEPVMLSMDETETFFHEFGHALHCLFSDVPYEALGSVPRDFVELPSQVMEHWALHPLMLKEYAKHYKTGEPMPKELVDRIQEVRNYGQGFATTELLAAALLDMDYHTLTAFPADLDPEKFEQAELNKKRGLIPEIYPRYKSNYFSHIMDGGYSAGYYSYIWSEVLDADAFDAYVESGDIFNTKIAESFRNDILKNGGMYDAMQMYVKFRGHGPDPGALLRSRSLL